MIHAFGENGVFPIIFRRAQIILYTLANTSKHEHIYAGHIKNSIKRKYSIQT